jgi:aquaporin Z
MYAYVAEFLGTLLLISVISFVGNPYAIGAALTGAILLVGSASGGHFNPAVSLWAFLSGKISSSTLVSYVVAQAAAAIVVVSLKSVI